MTPMQLRVFEAIRERIASEGVAPTYAEIAAATGLASRSRVVALVDQLEEHGLIERAPRKVRGLKLAGTPDLRRAATADLLAELRRRGLGSVAMDGGERPNFVRGAATCAADSCHLAVSRGQLFCRRHWFALPFTLRERIRAAFGARDEAEYQAAVTEARDRIDQFETIVERAV